MWNISAMQFDETLSFYPDVQVSYYRQVNKTLHLEESMHLKSK